MASVNGVDRYLFSSPFSGFVHSHSIDRIVHLQCPRSSPSSWISRSASSAFSTIFKFFLNSPRYWLVLFVNTPCPPRTPYITSNRNTHVVASRAKMIIIISHLIRCHRHVAVHPTVGMKKERTIPGHRSTQTVVIQSLNDSFWSNCGSSLASQRSVLSCNCWSSFLCVFYLNAIENSMMDRNLPSAS